uniref:Wall-associated receptor kinase galacturonan-binding domain-containing protein n=1 Tax=Nelumbo nucifera TaxID=4432 RepID=A0A822YZD5_NELNU|nr:TPA_asm: hypothetical protein HUJ06_013787 [Nelumbo nucifera]
MDQPMLLHFVILLLMTKAVVAPAAALSTSSLTKPGCQEKCGNVSIPYPFGVGDDPNCFLNEYFRLFCNTTNDALILDTNVPILNISMQGQLTTTIWAAFECYAEGGKHRVGKHTFWKLPEAYMISDTRNSFMTVSCHTTGVLYDYYKDSFYVGCISRCLNETKSTGLSCEDGLGCCQTTIPKGITGFKISTGSINNFSYTWNIRKF